MSVTPSHKYHEAKKDRFMFDPQVQNKTAKIFQSPKQRPLNNIILK